MISALILAGISFASDEDRSLVKQANKIFGPLPQAMVSEKNPITPGKVKLGKMLFYETGISVDGTVSCSRCHPIGLYAADKPRPSGRGGLLDWFLSAVFNDSGSKCEGKWEKSSGEAKLDNVKRAQLNFD